MCLSKKCPSYIAGATIKCDVCKSKRRLSQYNSSIKVELKKQNEILELKNRILMVHAVAESQLKEAELRKEELETYKRLAVVAQLDLSNERIKTQALQCSLDAKPNRDLANAVLRRENEMLKRRAEILSNLYFKLSDFVVDSTGEAIGYGLFCNIDITEFDIGMYLLDFIGFERMMTENEKNGRFRNKYLLSIGKGRVLDCQKKAKANICMASRCNQARGLRGKPTMHLEIVYDPPHFKIIAAASANSELLTTYHGIV